MKFFFHFFAFFYCAAPVFSQNVGFQGKRAILKFDAVSAVTERAIAAEMEYVLNRNFSAYLIGNWSSARYAQRLPAYSLDNGRDVPADTVALISDLQVGLGVKIYFSNAMPAPKRNYFFVSYQLGAADVKGNYYNYNALNPDKEGLDSYQLKQVPTSKIIAGFGYQTFFWNRVSADFAMGIAMGALDAPGKSPLSDCDYNCFLSGFSDKYGANTVSFGNWRAGKAGGMGLNVQLKLGVLLF